jgi:hypothetical protein
LLLLLLLLIIDDVNNTRVAMNDDDAAIPLELVPMIVVLSITVNVSNASKETPSFNNRVTCDVLYTKQPDKTPTKNQPTAPPKRVRVQTRIDLKRLNKNNNMGGLVVDCNGVT